MEPAPEGDLTRYQLGRQLGRRGGFGAAFEAIGADGGRYVVKLIDGMQDPAPDDLRRLQLMLARMSTVRCTQVVEIVDFGVQMDAPGGPLPWIAMPLIEGAKSLDIVLSQMDAPPPDWWVRSVVGQIALGLRALHGAGLMHRDLKPGNVLVDAAGNAWLIDFEIVKVLDVTTNTPAAFDPLGTRIYMAPEQCVGPVGPAADLWALGLILHELLTGEQPLVAAAQHGRDALLRAINAGSLVSDAVPAPWRGLCEALLRKLPAGRPRGAQAVIDWLADPDAVDLRPPASVFDPGVRWIVRDRNEVDAAEGTVAADRLPAVIDASLGARDDHRRLHTAARRLSLPIGQEPHLVLGERPVGLFSPLATDPVEAAVHEWLTESSGGPHGETLLPFVFVDDIGVDAAVHVIRVGARHRNLAGGRPLIATLHCSAALLADPARTLPLLAACHELRVDGWRLMVEGLQPGCSRPAIANARDAAEALAATGLPVWVRSGGIARWVMITARGTGISYRAGRGLYTKGRPPEKPPERIEVDRLAGPIPRKVAAELSLLRPDLFACPCRACRASGSRLPPEGRQTIAHNVAVLLQQMATARSMPDVQRRLAEAHALRAELTRQIDWTGELGDFVAVRALLSERDRQPAGPPALLLVA